jgi:hypothetical protein
MTPTVKRGPQASQNSAIPSWGVRWTEGRDGGEEPGSKSGAAGAADSGQGTHRGSVPRQVCLWPGSVGCLVASMAVCLEFLMPSALEEGAGEAGTS